MCCRTLPWLRRCPRRHCALWKDPGSSALSLNRYGVGIVLCVHGATPITCGRTTRMLDCAAHRARLRDVHASVTGSVIGRGVLGHHPGQRPRGDESCNDTQHDQQDPAVPRRERIGRRSLASVDRRRLLPSANSVECTITTLPSRCAVLGNGRRAPSDLSVRRTNRLRGQSGPLTSAGSRRAGLFIRGCQPTCAVTNRLPSAVPARSTRQDPARPRPRPPTR